MVFKRLFMPQQHFTVYNFCRYEWVIAQLTGSFARVKWKATGIVGELLHLDNVIKMHVLSCFYILELIHTLCSCQLLSSSPLIFAHYARHKWTDTGSARRHRADNGHTQIEKSTGNFCILSIRYLLSLKKIWNVGNVILIHYQSIQTPNVGKLRYVLTYTWIPAFSISDICFLFKHYTKSRACNANTLAIVIGAGSSRRMVPPTVYLHTNARHQHRTTQGISLLSIVSFAIIMRIHHQQYVNVRYLVCKVCRDSGNSAHAYWVVKGCLE